MARFWVIVLCAAMLAGGCQLIGGTPARGAAAAFRQTQFGHSQGVGTTVTAVFGQPVAVASLLVVSVEWNGSASAAVLTDTRGSSYTAAGPAQLIPGSDYREQTFYVANAAAGPNTVTATFPAGSTDRLIYAHEYTGVATASPVDAAVAAVGTASTMSAGPLTTTQPGALLYAVGMANGAVTAPTPGFTTRAVNAGNLIEDKTAAAAGSYSVTAAQDSQGWSFRLIAFKAAGAPAPAPLFTGDYETGNFSQWPVCQNTSYNSACTGYGGTHYSMKVQSAVKRQGNAAARFEVRDGDMPFCCGERAEVSGDTKLSSVEGDERWYQWSTQFGAGLPVDQGWSAVAQWHADADGPPPVAFPSSDDGLVNGNFGLIQRSYSNASTVTATNLIWQRPQQPGTWHDIKLHVKWSVSDSAGFIELWHNGVRQTFIGACAGQTRCALRTMVPGGGGVYYKQGYYRSPATTATGVVYHDGFTMAATEQALGPL